MTQEESAISGERFRLLNVFRRLRWVMLGYIACEIRRFQAIEITLGYAVAARSGHSVVTRGVGLADQGPQGPQAQA